MPKTEDELGPVLERQLRSALDRVRPPHSGPRYASGAAGVRRGSIAPALFTAAVAGILVLTLLAAAGSRSVDLQRRIVNTIQSGTSTPVAEPSPSPSPVKAQQPAPPVVTGTPRPEPTQSPEPSHEPGDDGSASPRPSDSPQPSPSPDE